MTSSWLTPTKHPHATILLHLPEFQASELQEILRDTGHQNILWEPKTLPEEEPKSVDVLITRMEGLPLHFASAARILCCLPNTDLQGKHSALKAGAHDLLYTPIDAQEALLRIEHQLHTQSLIQQLQQHNTTTENLLQEHTRDLEAALRGIHHILQRVSASLHDLTGRPTTKTTQLTHLLTQRLLDEETTHHYTLAVQYKDLGHALTQPDLLSKTTPLTPHERLIMQGHTIEGANLLKAVKHPVFTAAALMALTHHERWNGTGYPLGLKGHHIPLAGRIAAVAGVFDAMTNPRPYRPAFSLQETLRYFREKAGVLFDGEVVKLLPEAVRLLG
ncbi:HD-GYP domain-containing protein [Deinococcus misasensis]|uniref:HD-GYP domain-containing protein n=1 Tax=Deinococcus misasensis TaxID=392413 RepID=UPI0014701C8D|nr:HD domain-containing phosphohydrolase [Deinococcus misasensis]